MFRLKIPRNVRHLFIFALLSSPPLHAAALIDFDIPAQPLYMSLIAVGNIAKCNVLFDPKQLVGFRSLPLKARLTANEAISELLLNTPFQLEQVDTNTVNVLRRLRVSGGDASLRVGNTELDSDDDRFGIGRSTQDTHVGDARRRGRNVGDAGQDKGLTNTSGIAEVIVSAEKREERLQDVPVPVTAISGATLVESNQLRIEDYFTRIPGLNVISGNGIGSTLSIRGLSTGNGFINPTVGIVVDDVPYGSTTGLGGGNFGSPDIDPSDLARVEVLRGPQGTLYGASSIGGLLKFVTTDPSPERLSAHAQAGTSSVDGGDKLGYNFRAAVNLPLSENVAISASGFARQDPGYIDDPGLRLKSVNRIDFKGGRLSALWRPSESFSLKLGGLIQDIKAHGKPNVFLLPELGEMQQSYTLPRYNTAETKVNVFSANAAATLGVFNLTSVTGYSENSNHTADDYTFLFGPPGTALLSNNKTKKFTQEVRLAASFAQRIDWLLGAFYTHETSPFDQRFVTVDPEIGVIDSSVGDFNFPSSYSEYAVFTDLTYHVSDRIDIQLGGRESHNRQSYSEVDTGSLVGGTVINPEVRTNSNSFTYLVTPRFRISPDLMVYARIASGYRPGGPNSSCILLSVPCKYEPDKTSNFELGVKGGALEDALSFDGSIYYIDWNQIELAFTGSNGFAYTLNASRAKSQGIEISVEAKPLRGLEIAAWISVGDAVLTKGFPADDTIYGVSGDRLPFSSHLSGSISINEQFNVTNSLTGFVGATVSYVGNRVGNFLSSPERQIYPGYAQTDARAGLSYDSWTINLFCNNITNKRGLLNGGVGGVQDYAFTYITPRTVGISLAKQWN